MSDALIGKDDVITPEELLAAAGVADGMYDQAADRLERAEQDPGGRRQAELHRAKVIRWLVNECLYGEPCDPETGEPNWDRSVDDLDEQTYSAHVLDEDHTRALRYAVALVGEYEPLDEDEAWFQNLVD